MREAPVLKRLQYSVTSVFATVNLGMQVNLRDVALQAKNAEYNPRRFPAVMIKVREPDKATGMLYGSGKLSVVGCKSEEIARQVARKIAKSIKGITGSNLLFKNFQVVNIIAHSEINFEVSFEHFVSKYYKLGACYEPEIYSGLVQSFKNPKLTFILFKSGKINITGARSREDIDATL